MTPLQRRALAHPCRLAIETAHPRFTHKTSDQTTRVTVNTGWE